MFLGSQNQAAFTHPYSVTWVKGGQPIGSWGMAVSHIDANQRAYGPKNTTIPGSPVQYYINPIGIQSIIVSATELGGSAVLTTDNLQASSVNANLLPKTGSTSKLSFPLVQGMGFVTGIYSSLTPLIRSGVFFRNVVFVGSPSPGIFKYRITLEDGKIWLLYAIPSNGQNPKLVLKSNTSLQGLSGWSGTIQVAKNPAGFAGEAIYDRCTGVYAMTATISGSTSGTSGTYEIQFTKASATRNQSPPLIMFALPHHVQSFAGATASSKTSIQLQTTTKGMAVAVLANSWTLVEPNLPTSIGFAPWTPSGGSATSLSATAIQVINQTAYAEVNQDMNAQSNLNSMYYSGKALSKFATLVYTIHDLAQDPDLALQGLMQLKGAYARFVNNKQIHPLVYDTAWKGVVSSGTYMTGDSGLDFGKLTQPAQMCSQV